MEKKQRKNPVKGGGRRRNKEEQEGTGRNREDRGGRRRKEEEGGGRRRRKDGGMWRNVEEQWRNKEEGWRKDEEGWRKEEEGWRKEDVCSPNPDPDILLRLRVTPTLNSKLQSIHMTYSDPTPRLNPKSPIYATLH